MTLAFDPFLPLPLAAGDRPFVAVLLVGWAVFKRMPRCERCVRFLALAALRAWRSPTPVANFEDPRIPVTSVVAIVVRPEAPSPG